MAGFARFERTRLTGGASAFLVSGESQPDEILNYRKAMMSKNHLGTVPMARGG
jgi:hypothetical protein